MPQLKPAISARNAVRSVPHLPAAAAAVTALILSLLSAAPTACAKSQPPMVGVTGVARPWRDVQLSFSRAGRIDKIFVYRGQA
jgi:multidrug efflux pump subunit AcrA (membrane-fusion protein)